MSRFGVEEPLHPAVLIMKTKLEKGLITQSEYDIMTTIHTRASSAEAGLEEDFSPPPRPSGASAASAAAVGASVAHRNNP